MKTYLASSPSSATACRRAHKGPPATVHDQRALVCASELCDRLVKSPSDDDVVGGQQKQSPEEGIPEGGPIPLHRDTTRTTTTRPTHTMVIHRSIIPR